MSLLPLVGLAAITLGWFLLPLVPAILELFRPTDIRPLTVVPRDAGDVGFLARGFRSYLHAQLERLPAALPDDYLGRLPDGTRFARVRAGPTVLAPRADGRGVQDRVVVLESPDPVPGDQTFLQEIHARVPFTGGSGAIYRALLGDDRVSLGDGSRVLRWVHAAGPVVVGNRTVLAGRTSSDRRVVLGQGVSFARVGAPEIRVGGSAPEAPTPIPPAPVAPPADARRIGDHLRVPGDFSIPDGGELRGNLVVTGRLVVGRQAVIAGNVKAHGPIEVRDGARIEGSLVGRVEIAVGTGAVVAGPVIAEGAATFGPGSRIGSEGRPTTIAARSVRLGAACAVFGQVTAPEGGITD